MEWFLKATVKGWQTAIENTDEAALLAKNYEGNDEKGTIYNDEHLKFVLQASSPLIHTGDNHLGLMEKDVFENAQRMLIEQEVIKKPVDIEDVYTMQFLNKVYGE